MHVGAGDSGALGGDSPGEAAAGRGISGGGGADILAPGSGISFRCGWIGEESAVPPGESGALGDGVPPCGWGIWGGDAGLKTGE